MVNGTKLFGPVTLQGREQILMGASILELEAASPPVRSVAPPAVAVGEVLPAAPGVPGPPPSPPPSPVASTPVRPESGNRRTLVIALAVVVALVAGAGGFVILTGDDDDPQPGGGAGGDEALAPLANLGAQPGDFSADPSTWTVTLTWSDAPRVVGLDHYEVSRNGTTLDDAVTQTTFVDDGALPGERLDYEVVAVGSGGATEPAAVPVKAPKVAVADALSPWLVRCASRGPTSTTRGPPRACSGPSSPSATSAPATPPSRSAEPTWSEPRPPRREGDTPGWGSGRSC
jgi:hypothetical protein